jgi:hypothetical protein
MTRFRDIVRARYKVWLSAAIAFVFLVLTFQNCSKVHFTSLSSEGLTLNNNGATYGGKPEQDYYHYIPGYSCENRPSAFSKIAHFPLESHSVFFSSKENQCLSQSQTIPNSEIDAGSLQNKVIGYGERIFESNPAGPLVVPESPIEIWCVDQWSNPTIEILSLYNKSINRAETQFYYPGLPKRSELNPARSINLQTVRLTSTYFDLIVEKSQIGNKPGTFQGRVTLNESSQVQNLQCRLGGYLDARLWPAKAVNYNVLEQMEWNPLEGLFYMITGQSGAPWSENILSTYSADGIRKKVLMGNSQNAQGPKKFNFSANHSKLFVQAHLSGDSSIQLYSVDPKTAAPPRRINALLTDFGQLVSGDVIYDPKGDLVYYLDGSQEVGGDIEQWLYSVSLSTGQITQINQSLFRADEMVGQYDVSTSLGKIVYSTGFTEHEIWITDTFGSTPRKINLAPFLGSTNYIAWYIKKSLGWQLINDRYLVLAASNRNPVVGPSLLLTIDLLSEKVIYSQTVKGSLFLLPVEGLPLVTVLGANDSFNFLDLSTNTLNTSEQIILSQKASPNPLAQQFAANLTVVTAKDLCANDEDLASRIAIDKERWLLIKKGTNLKSSIFIFTTKTNTCTLINHLVFPGGYIESLFRQSLQYPMLQLTNIFGTQYLKAQMSPDQRNLLVAIMGRLYLIPVDGHPVIEIYTPLNATPSFGEIGFINNSKIYFMGSVIKDYVNQLFLWDVPSY